MIHVDKKIAGNALSLPVTQRVELVELLLASLDSPDKAIDELWALDVTVTLNPQIFAAEFKPITSLF